MEVALHRTKAELISPRELLSGLREMEKSEDREGDGNDSALHARCLVACVSAAPAVLPSPCRSSGTRALSVILLCPRGWREHGCARKKTPSGKTRGVSLLLPRPQVPVLSPAPGTRAGRPGSLCCDGNVLFLPPPGPGQPPSQWRQRPSRF